MDLSVFKIIKGLLRNPILTVSIKLEIVIKIIQTPNCSFEKMRINIRNVAKPKSMTKLLVINTKVPDLSQYELLSFSINACTKRINVITY